MNDDTSSRGLIDPRTMGLRAMAERLKLPIPAQRVEPASRELLQLGRLSAISGLEYTDVAAFVERKVAVYNKISQDERNRTGSSGNRRIVPFEDYWSTYEEYVGYVMEHQGMEAVLAEELTRPRYIQEGDRRAHTLVTGGSRSGKSELLKLLIHHYVRHPELGGVLILDPHNELAPQVARWKEFAGDGAERLVYLNPSLGAEMGRGAPALNPLQVAGLPDQMRSTLAKQLASSLAHLSGEGETLSGQMVRVAEFCLTALMDVEGGSLVDLWRGLKVEPRDRQKVPAPLPPFVMKGREHPNEVVRDFFESGWENESYRGSRDALKRRLETFLSSTTFKEIMEAPQPLNLEALLSAGKVVVVNCGFESEAGRALGRLLTAQVAAIGERRNQANKGKEAPFHVFVDEATELMTPTFVRILEGVGKRNIWLTMGQQEAGAGGDSGHANRIATNTGLKFLGRTRNTKELMRFVELRREKVPMLNQGEFIVTQSGRQKVAMLLQTPYPSPVAKDDNAMSEREFAAVLEYQFANYYRRPALRPETPTGTPPSMDRPSEGAKHRPRGDDWGNA